MPALNPLGAREPAASYPSKESSKTHSTVQNRQTPFRDTIKSQNSEGSSFLDGVKSAFASLWKCIVAFFTCTLFGKSESSRPESQTVNRRDVPAPRSARKEPKPYVHYTGATPHAIRRSPAPDIARRGSAPVANPALEAQCKQLAFMADNRPEIRFYDLQYNPVTAFMSNFYISPITVDGFTFQTGEAYFHAQKHWHNKSIVQEFANTKDGDEALAVNKKHKMTPPQLARWEGTDGKGQGHRITAMRNVLKEKFEQNPDLQKLLLSTKGTSPTPAKLSEFNPGKGQDAFWSTGPRGGGQDVLGKLMMEIRDYFNLPVGS